MRNQAKDRERQRRHYQANAELVKENARKWRLANPGKRREAYRRYQLKNAAHIRETNRKKMRKGWLEGEHERAEACKPGAGYCCPICKTAASDWVADHHAASGVFREWLCRPCNMALGLFRERHQSLLAAVEYLTKHSRA